MRSLSLLKSTTLRLPQNSPDVSRYAVSVTIDPVSSFLYLLSADSFLTGINRENPEDIYEAELVPPTDEQGDHVVGIQYLAENDSVCVALKSGDILLYNRAAGTLDCVGNVDTGLLVMAWSPDFELVILVTGAGTLLQMTKDFEMLNEIPIEVDTNGEAVPVSVGWGKKETQFHGSAGKYANQKKEVINPSLSEDDDGRPRVSWRGDAQFFVCSSVNEKGDKRVLRMYNRECALQSTSEEVPRLEHPLCWRPSGNLITSTQRLPQKHDVVFFEKNGLRHGEFSLREECRVIELAWNSDSSLLAISLEKPDGYFVQLWSMNNYHYYLKHEISYPTGVALTSMSWDPESPFSLHVTLDDGHYMNYEFCWDIYSSSSLSAENAGTVAVVDGANLLLTPFKFMNVPPPMSAFKLALPSAISHVSFSPSLERSNDFAVLCRDSSVHFFGSNGKAKVNARPTAPVSHGSIQLPPSKKPIGSLRQVAWVSPTTLLLLESGDEDNHNQDTLVKIELSNVPESGAEGLKIAHIGRTSCSEQILRLQYNPNDKFVVLESVSKALFRISFEGAGQSPGISGWNVTLPSVCQWISTVNTRKRPENNDAAEEDAAEDESDIVLVSLNNRGKLFANGTVLATNCNSYHIHSDFLIYTTFSHLSRFVLLSEILEPRAEVQTDTFDESVRPVERGSSIVVSIPHDVSLVLQMPRGNLETVCPRALVLSTVRDALDSLDFKKALLLARKHRIDMNILHDHNPERFFQNLTLLLSQIDDPEHLNLFLSGLKNENVNETMYRGVSSAKPKPMPKEWFSSKINRVCDDLRILMLSLDADKYMKSILTAYVCKSPPDIEAALLLIKKAQGDAKRLDSMLKYATFLVDVNQLFDVALGLYDFELVLSVAQRSQKDPKEYLPFLSQLQKLEPNYRKFKIDDHLKRFKKAIRNLCAAGDAHFEEALQYTIRHALYPEALEGYAADAEKSKAVLKAYGEYLDTEGKHQEAGFVFSTCGETAAALASYQKCASWRNVFTMAGILGIQGPELVQLGRATAEALKDRGQFQDSATVSLTYAKDPEQAVTTLVISSLWEEALRVAHTYGRADLIETTVKPGVLGALATIMEDLASASEQFLRERARLDVVRAEKQQRMDQMDQLGLSAGQQFANENVDMFSDTSSLASNATRSTRTASSVSSRMSKLSSKNKRKMERKKLSSKEGGIFEEEYLMESFKGVVEKANKYNGEIRDLLAILLVFGHREKARQLQAAYGEFLGLITTHLDSIFLPVEQQLERQKQMQALNPDAVLEKIFEKPAMVTLLWKNLLLS